MDLATRDLQTKTALAGEQFDHYYGARVGAKQGHTWTLPAPLGSKMPLAKKVPRKTPRDSSLTSGVYL
ncbi:MAG: hypothetical protein R2709_15845 [Marmoricola sp.]